MKTNKLIVSIIAMTLMTGSMGFARYKSQPLKNIDTHNTQVNTAKDNSVSFNYKIFTANDCKKHFNTTSIIKKGYQPIQIIFTNNSKYSIAISPDNFSFRCADFRDVANILHRDGMARLIGFGLGSLWFMPLIFPAFIQGFGADDYNEAMDMDFSQKALKVQVVPPYTTIEGVIFASRNEFRRNFTLTVEDIDKKISFTLYSL
jgi:hypothetical protein